MLALANVQQTNVNVTEPPFRQTHRHETDSFYQHLPAINFTFFKTMAPEVE